MIRAALPEDQAYVASTWVRSLTSMTRARGSKDVAANHLYVNRMLDHRDMRVLVSIDEWWIVGWIAYSSEPTPIAHMLYMRLEYRRQGRGAALVAAAQSPRVHTFGLAGAKWLRPRLAELTYVPADRYLSP